MYCEEKIQLKDAFLGRESTLDPGKSAAISMGGTE